MASPVVNAATPRRSPAVMIHVMADNGAANTAHQSADRSCNDRPANGASDSALHLLWRFSACSAGGQQQGHCDRW